MKLELEMRKVGVAYRVLAAGICFVAILAGIGVVAFGMRDNWITGALALLIPLTLIYVCWPIAARGYPPKCLMWAMDKR